MKNCNSSTSGEPAKILLVDDNKMGLAARKAVLEELGYIITTALEGQEALQRFLEHHYDLVITDFRMPKMDGIRLIEQLRKTSPEVPIILISGFVEALGLNEKTTGADCVVAKNAAELPALVRSVAKLLRRNAPKKPVSSLRAQARARRQGV